MLERKLFLVLNLIWLIVIASSPLFGTPWPAVIAIISWIPVFDQSRWKPFLPSLMYHSVSDHYQHFPKSQLCISLKNFRWAMAWLKLRKYRTLSFAEAEAFTRGEIHDQRCIHLTFDDGYLDNWVNVYPVLKKHGFKGTVFVTDEFIRREGEVRPIRRTEDGDRLLDEWGFMNEAEIKRADQSGVLEFLPHGKTHTWYPCADELVGFHIPGDRQVWLDWNLSPERKADWITEFPQGIAGPGWPIFRFGKSLEVKAFRVNDDLLEQFQKSVAEEGMTRNAEKLLESWHEFRRRYPEIGRMESDDEFEARLREELGSTKEYLEHLLCKPCEYFCWPGGGKQALSLRIAYEELGYRMTTTHQYHTPNRKGRPSRWLYRISPGYSLTIEHPVWNLLRFISQVETMRRNYCWITMFAIGHAVEGLLMRLGRRKRALDIELSQIGVCLAQADKRS